MSRNTSASRALYELAAHQRRYFTARQAREAGYQDNVHPYDVRPHNWINVLRQVMNDSSTSVQLTISGRSARPFKG